MFKRGISSKTMSNRLLQFREISRNPWKTEADTRHFCWRLRDKEGLAYSAKLKKFGKPCSSSKQHWHVEKLGEAKYIGLL